MGRPTKLTPAMKRRVCDLLRKGLPREHAARRAGIGECTFHRWMAAGEAASSGVYREFRQAVLDAEDALVESACRNVVNLQGPRNPPAVRLAASKIVLTRLARKRELFSERIEITGAEGGAVQVAATVQPLLSDAQVAALSPEQLEAAIRAQLGT